MRPLVNDYFGLRHGESHANRLGLIVSDPTVALSDFGLTDRGRQQVEHAIRTCSFLSPEVLILCSDFKRATETATIVTRLLGCAPPVPDRRLRERRFGAWEQTSVANYGRVWSRDAVDPRHEANGCESAQAVRDRLLALIESVESEYHHRPVLLVSHGDPLQLLATAFAGRAASEHRQIEPWATAEIRAFQRQAHGSVTQRLTIG